MIFLIDPIFNKIHLIKIDNCSFIINYFIITVIIVILFLLNPWIIILIIIFLILIIKSH